MTQLNWDQVTSRPDRPRIVKEVSPASGYLHASGTTYYKLSRELEDVPGCIVVGIDNRGDWKVWAKELVGDDEVGSSIENEGAANCYGLVYNGEDDYPEEMHRKTVLEQVLQTRVQ